MPMDTEMMDVEWTLGLLWSCLSLQCGKHKDREVLPIV